MRGLTRFVSMLVFAGLAGTGVVQAQTKKVFQRKDVHGQAVQTPYITYEEFRSVLVRTPGGQVPLRKLLSVSSLEEVSRLLGQPESIERNEDPDDKSFSAKLHYEGKTTLEYVATSDGKTVSLSSIKLWSPGWSLKIGDTNLHPGMEVDSLSPAVRQSISAGSWFSEHGIDHFGSVDVMKPGAAAKAAGRAEEKLLQRGKAEFAVHIDRKAGTVEVVQFTRIPF